MTTITEDNKFKQTDKLVKAVMELNTRFKKEQEIAKKAGDTFSYRGFFSSVKQSGVARMRDTFSAKGIAGMMGVKDDSLLGSLLSARHQFKVEKAEEQDAQAKAALKFAQGFRQYTKEGSNLSEEEAIKRGTELFEKRLELQKQITNLEHEMQEAREYGDTDVIKEQVEQLKTLREQLGGPKNKIHHAIKDDARSEPDLAKITSLLMKSGLVKQRAVEAYSKRIGRPLTEEEGNNLESGIREGMMAELLKANEEQVEQLRKLVDAAQPSVEDKLESGIKTGTVVTKDGKKEKKGSFLDTIMSKFSGIAEGFKSFISAISAGTKMLISSLTSIAGLLANPVVLAGLAAVVAAGSLIYMLSKEKVGEGDGSVEKFGETSTLAGALSAGTSGAEAASIMSAVEDNELSPEEIRKNQAQEQEMLKDAPWYTRIYGVGKDEYLKKKGYMKEGDPHSTFGTGQPYRSSATNSLVENRIRNEELANKVKEATPMAASSPVVNNVNVNNSTKVSKMVPPVRNIEASYNARLSKTFG